MNEYCDDDISTGGNIDIDDALDGDISQRIGDNEEVYGNNSISDNLDRSVGARTGDSAVDNANEGISSYLTAVINESVSNVQNDSENRSNLDTQLDDKNCAFREEITKEQDNLYKDLYDSFKPSLAYYSYVLFCRVLGDHFMGSILYNEDLIWQLCSNYDEGLTLTSTNDVFMSQEATKTALTLQGTAKDADVEGIMCYKDVENFYKSLQLRNCVHVLKLSNQVDERYIHPIACSNLDVCSQWV